MWTAGSVEPGDKWMMMTRASNRIFFHFPVSEGYNRVDNRIANIVKIIG